MNYNNFGYAIVRLPEFVGEFSGEKPSIIPNSHGNNTYYYGIDRDPWWDFDELFYSGGLTKNFESIRRKIITSKLKSFSPGVCFDIRDAREVLELSNRASIYNEIIVVTPLPEIEGVVGPGTICGFDCYVDGYGSLLRSGLFQQVDLFNDFLPDINNFGLFDSLDDIRLYIDAYLERCIENCLEPIDEGKSDIDIFTVSRCLS